MTDIIGEINGAGDVGAALATLRAAGVADRILLTSDGIFGALTLAPVEALPDGTFSFSEGNREAVVIAVRDEYGDLADLVAWRPDAPCRWWRRLGAATFAGEYAVRKAAFCRLPLQVFASPLSWLQADCLGAVVLDPEAAIRADLDGVPEIWAETIELGRSIKRQLADRTSFRHPKITVPEPAARAA